MVGLAPLSLHAQWAREGLQRRCAHQFSTPEYSGDTVSGIKPTSGYIFYPCSRRAHFMRSSANTTSLLLPLHAQGTHHRQRERGAAHPYTPACAGLTLSDKGLSWLRSFYPCMRRGHLQLEARTEAPNLLSLHAQGTYPYLSDEKRCATSIPTNVGRISHH